MSKKAQGKPWHFAEEAVHHDNSMCAQGKKSTNRLDGTGQKPKCPDCAKLNGMK